jgi:hypothetical protein
MVERLHTGSVLPDVVRCPAGPELVAAQREFTDEIGEVGRVEDDVGAMRAYRAIVI